MIMFGVCLLNMCSSKVFNAWRAVIPLSIFPSCFALQICLAGLHVRQRAHWLFSRSSLQLKDAIVSVSIQLNEISVAN